MEDLNFKAGDVVQLRSGGPKMTVTETEPKDGGATEVYVTWFDNKHEPKFKSASSIPRNMSTVAE